MTERLVTKEPEEAVHGTLSIVIDGSKRGLRKLPSLYIGRGQVFADRSVDAVVDRLMRCIRAADEGQHVPVYGLNACSFKGAHGLYGVDTFNRSKYRLNLRRAGFQFSADPYVQLTDEGTFRSEDWDEFVPRFAILGDGVYREEVTWTTQGWLPFWIASNRLGPLGPQELNLLIRLTRGMKGLSVGDPKKVIVALRESLDLQK